MTRARLRTAARPAAFLAAALATLLLLGQPRSSSERQGRSWQAPAP